MTDETVVTNSDLRPAMRGPGRPPNVAKLSNADDPRARAAARAAEIRASREGREDDGVDEFKAPPAPDGWEYQWKRKSTFQKEDRAHLNALKRSGWEEVPASRHPDFMSVGMTGSNIEYKEMVLMEAPLELVQEARGREYRTAKAQLSRNAGQIDQKPGTMLGNQEHTAPVTKHRTSFEAPMRVPD